jgi:hypothetical protein
MGRTILAILALIMGSIAILLACRTSTAPNAVAQWAGAALFAMFAIAAGACAILETLDERRASR